MSRLAREELRHYEQVKKLMRERDIPFSRLDASRYAATLRAAARTAEPHRLTDALIIGALIEAPAFYPTLTGQENLRVFAALGGYDRRRIAEIVEMPA